VPFGHGVSRSICGNEDIHSHIRGRRPHAYRARRRPSGVPIKPAPQTPQLRRVADAPTWLSAASPAAHNTQRRSSAQEQQGAVHFFLQRVNGGLYVEREEIPRHGIRVCQSLLFNQRAHFERWRSDDPVHFEHPLLYRQLQRDAAALWDLESTERALSR
jgi:hypothetical protein